MEVVGETWLQVFGHFLVSANAIDRVGHTVTVVVSRTDFCCMSSNVSSSSIGFSVVGLPTVVEVVIDNFVCPSMVVVLGSLIMVLLLHN